MSLKEKISQDTIAAMRLKDKGRDRLATLRLLQAAIKQKEVDDRQVVTDNQLYAILSKMIKQRKDSIVQFKLGCREDLVAKEQREIDVLQSYLPQPLTENTLDKIIRDVIIKVQASSFKDIGKVMAQLKESIQGRADMKQVSDKVKALLNK